MIEMKLSEAIRAGKRFGDIRTTYADGCRACAIGGALMASLDCAELPGGAVVKRCAEIWPDIASQELVCPLHGKEYGDGGVHDCSEGGYEELTDDATGNPFEIASHLYSDHGWSKDEVAKWVEENIES